MLIFIIIIFQLILLFSSISVNIELTSKNERNPVDYEIKNIDECYLTVHNFITLKSSDWNTSKDDLEFKTYVYSYSKPYLIELVQNSTHDCLCCN